MMEKILLKRLFRKPFDFEFKMFLIYKGERKRGRGGREEKEEKKREREMKEFS